MGWKSVKISDENYNWLNSKGQSPNEMLDLLREGGIKLPSKIEGIEEALKDVAKLKLSVSNHSEQILKIQEVIERVIQINTLKTF